MREKNSSEKLADNFIGVYPVSKTLRFELIPQGKTLEYIARDGILDSDHHRAENYQKVKELIDRYHKIFIDEALQSIRLENLSEYERLYSAKRDEKQDREFQEIQTSLRKQIAKKFRSHSKYKNLFNKELIKKELILFLKDEPEKRSLVEEFADFTTYFTGFNANRENMYSDEAKGTAIAYRIVHENLPKFIDNMNAFKCLKESGAFLKVKDSLPSLQKKFGLDSVEYFFTIDGFTQVLSQKGIDIYNGVLGGYICEDDTKIQGLNEIINLYNQQQKGEKNRLPKLKVLYKQILSDRESNSFVLDKFENGQEVLEAVKNCYVHFYKYIFEPEEEMSLNNLINDLENFDLGKIYIANDVSITDISQYIYGDWSILRKAISEDYDRHHLSEKMTRDPEKYEDKKQKELKRRELYSIRELNRMAQEYAGTVCNIENYFILQISERLMKINHEYEACRSLLEGESEEKELYKDKNAVLKLKNLLDAMKELQLLIKPLIKGREKAEKDELFYVELVRIWDELNAVNQLYNKVRNYATQKPYSLEKVKLNFNKSTLLDGWDRNKEKDNLGVILIKDNKYYLGIMNRNSNRVMEDAPAAVSTNRYQKMEYKLLPGPNKMLPKVFFSASRIDEFAPDEELLEKYKEGTHKKGDNFSLEDCHRLIDFFKRSLKKHPEWSEFDFSFSDTETYKDISGFYREVERQGYKITFKDIDADYIEKLVEEGQLYLFQIYNKDFSPYSKGTPNLHTIYWKTLFSPDNLKDVVYKLNGQAEIFYRRKSIEEKDIICHPSNEELRNKYPKAEKPTSKFPYELTKDRRFTVDKFQFHVPITMNFKAKGENYFNRKVRRLIHNCQDMHVIGIDRGERNLLYLSVIDMQGKIKEQLPLNDIVSTNKNEVIHHKDYHLLLEKREEENKAARQDWQTINTIKELKEGYLSQAIHIIAELMLKYNAIVVLEDLNFGFMRSRQKFEKQIYQKFERMLIDKLNYLVDKKRDINENGGALRAYQLTDKFESFQKLGKQSGFLFYVPAWNTSKIDPSSGFVNLFYTKYETKEKTRDFIKKFDSIIYNEQENYFEFYFDYSNFTYKAEGSRTKWCLCTEGNRIETFRNPAKNAEWDTKEIILTEGFAGLLEKYHISWKSGEIKKAISEIEEAEFYRSFMHFMSLLLQMRNSDKKAGEDWLMSPVKNSRGEFFKTDKDSEDYPRDADANGAYNIAKKGLWIIEQIQKTEIDQLDKVKIAISNKEWLAYAQEHVL